MVIRLSDESKFECVRCGANEKQTKTEFFPTVLAEMGNFGKLKCRICGWMWIQEKEASNGTR